MQYRTRNPRLIRSLQAAAICFWLVALPAYPDGDAKASNSAPVPLLTAAHPVDWWFVFKFNASFLPGCATGASRACPFGGTVQTTPKYKTFSQQFAYASSEHDVLQLGSDYVGDTTTDPRKYAIGYIIPFRKQMTIWPRTTPERPLSRRLTHFS